VLPVTSLFRQSSYNHYAKVAFSIRRYPRSVLHHYAKVDFSIRRYRTRFCITTPIDFSIRRYRARFCMACVEVDFSIRRYPARAEKISKVGRPSGRNILRMNAKNPGACGVSCRLGNTEVQIRV
jgi:hypothetical protein